jgi:hypothetical protein
LARGRSWADEAVSLADAAVFALGADLEAAAAAAVAPVLVGFSALEAAALLALGAVFLAVINHL